MFKGTGTALITPFNEDYSVDYESLEKNIEIQIKNNISALVILGTTGESPTIEDDERREIVKISNEIINKRVPLIIGTGGNNTKKAVRHSKWAEEDGADGLLVVTPYYNKTTQKGLTEYYSDIANETKLPLIMYNVPSRTGLNILPETAVEIFEKIKNVVAIKEASGNISQIAKLTAVKKDDFFVYSGNDDQTIPVMALGGVGVISVFSNVFPGKMSEITSEMLNGNIKKAQKLNAEYNEIMNELFVEVNPIPVKYAMAQKKMCKNILRKPLLRLNEAYTEKMNRLLREADGI
ncbi:MAG: 4-hydroxy-tetrahydrodipicolinate synthase [Thermotogae bacterium]|nr:4-hydroxy-tetrahydrodipicolinate synthase [Thermotogota bacterium]HOO75401.1 4-hydroxy-tetrahydrodipicolinate synthase [Tepiditoga sp.]